jgi:ABC-type oligopeptide transport system substrate-binding subunit
MWRAALGVETEIVLKSWDDYEAALQMGDYDVARRSIVMQTADEESNIRAMFAQTAPDVEYASSTAPASTPEHVEGKTNTAPHAETQPGNKATKILTERDALRELPAMPVYFASSYALVKPYVSGFDTNLIDAPSLQRVHIETNWQPPPTSNPIANAFHR